MSTSTIAATGNPSSRHARCRRWPKAISYSSWPSPPCPCLLYTSKRAIDDGLFPSLRRLATSIGAQVGNVSTAIQLASLPPEVIEAFPSPLSLQFRWGAALKAAIDKSPDDVLVQARELAAMTPKLPAKEVLARLTGVGASTTREAPAQITCKGKVVGVWDKDPKGNVSVQIKAGSLSAAKEKRLREFLEKLFD